LELKLLLWQLSRNQETMSNQLKAEKPPIYQKPMKFLLKPSPKNGLTPKNYSPHQVQLKKLADVSELNIFMNMHNFYEIMSW